MRAQSLLLWLVSVCLFTLALQTPASAATPTAALRSAPVDAAFYVSWLRNREQVDAVMNSRAYKTIAELPVVKAGWAKLLEEWEQNDDNANFRALWNDPNFQEALPLLTEMVSDEVVFFGDAQFDKLLAFQKEFNLVNWRTSLRMARALGKPEEELDEEQQAQLMTRSMLDVAHAHLDALHAPALVWAFRIRDKALAAKQLSKLEAALQPLVAEVPQLKDRLARQKVGGDDLLVLSLDGKQIPWEEIDAKAEKAQSRPGQYAAVKAKLSAEKLVIALGVRGDYVVVLAGPSTDLLATWGALPAGKSLADAPPFQRLAQANERMVGLYYMSANFLSRAAYTPADFDAVVKLLDEEIPWDQIPDGQNGLRAKSDLHELFADLKSIYPTIGGVFSYSQLTPTGLESWSYSQITPAPVDASKPLTLLEHAGGKPLWVSVGRSSWKPGTVYLGLAKWVKVLHGYFADFVLPLATDEQRKTFDEFDEKFGPASRRFDTATRTLFFPALGDGQWGFVLSATPAGEKPDGVSLLGFPTLALVTTVSDPKKLELALAEYKAAAEDLVIAVGKLQPEEAAKIKIPAPEVRETKAGKIYSYTLQPPGQPVILTLQAGLGPDVAVLSFSPAQTETLLAKQLTVGGELTDSSKPAGAVSYWSWAAMVDAILENEFVAASLKQAQDDPQQAEVVQGITAVKATRVWRSSTTRTWVEGKDVVQRWVWEFKDE